MDYPKLRNVEALPVQTQGRTMICLRDPQGLTENLVFLPPDLFFAVRLFDGRHSLLDIQTAYTRRFGSLLFTEKIQELVRQLDEQYLLESDRFRERKQEQDRSFRALEVRPAMHAGEAYAADPEELTRQLDAFFTAPEGPGEPSPELREDRLTGIIAPHIDLERGGACFAWAYKELIENTSAELFILLGTVHVPTENLFALTRKDFETPLGVAKTERGFVESLAIPSADLFADEPVHRREHSLEFQVVFLQHLLASRRDARIVPILCGSFHELLSDDHGPSEDLRVVEFVDALRRAISSMGERVCLIAGADLAHVGPRFGGREPLTPAFLQGVEEQDREMLGYVERLDPEGFLRFIAREEDRRNICGLSPIYTMLRAISATGGKLLRYDKAVDPSAQSAVTFASLAFYGG